MRWQIGLAALAQLVERVIRNDEVACSSHASGTIAPLFPDCHIVIAYSNCHIVNCHSPLHIVKFAGNDICLVCTHLIITYMQEEKWSHF